MMQDEDIIEGRDHAGGTGFIKAWLSRMRSQTGQHLDKMINLCLLIYKMADF